jgi:DNA-binding Lrp family transcriptional regulator
MDLLDLKILERMSVDGRVAFKELANLTKTDQRTVASRFERLMRLGIIRRVTVEIDWAKVGLTTRAYMGSATALGHRDREKLFRYLRKEPRVVWAATTIGTHEYFMETIDVDVKTLRKEVCSELEPLTSNLETSIVTDQMKQRDQTSLLEYFRKRRFADT